jgi:hypothetical protein
MRKIYAAAGAAALLAVTGAIGAATSGVMSSAAASEYNLRGGPSASFLWFPHTPKVGEVISLVSTSIDFTSPIAAYGWDVSDNGPFGAFLPGAQIITTSFATPAPHLVRLRVTDRDGIAGFAAETIHMSNSLPGVISPFPIVRIAGVVLRSAVKLRLLAVKAPRGAAIDISCGSRACPLRLRDRIAAASGKGGAFVRFRRFQRRLRAGVKLEIRASKRGEVGAYTLFRVRRRRFPVRKDSCLDPSGVRPIACPAS